MKRNSLLSLMLVSVPLCIPQSAQAANQAKVLMAKGDVKATHDGKTFTVTNGQMLDEHTTIDTGPASVAKFQLPDNSVMTLGPKGKLVLENIQSEINKKDPTLINVVSGALRGQVEKQKGDDKNPKMLIRTRSAVMGIRGTDFQTVYNPDNNISNVVTFEGEVAMVKNEGESKEKAIRNLIESAASVKEGTAALTNMANDHEISPSFKISPTQFNALKENTNFVQGDKKAQANAKRAPSLVIPPGLNAQAVAGKDSLVSLLNIQFDKNDYHEKSALNNGGKNDFDVVTTKASATEPAFEPDPNAPAPGGFVDMNTGLYVPPPPGSTFDSNTGVFMPPADVGTIDTSTGEYVSPPGIELTPEGKFVAVVEDSATDGATPTPPPTVPNINLNATIASVTMSPTADPAPDLPPPSPPTMLDNPAITANLPTTIGLVNSTGAAEAAAAISTKANVVIKVKYE